MFWKRKEASTAAPAGAALPALTGAPLKFNSVEFRDGQQSLFATRMTTEDMLPILPLMDEVGYDSMEMWGGRYLRCGGPISERGSLGAGPGL